MIYERSEPAPNNKQYYFYQYADGTWEFTHDRLVLDSLGTQDRLDFDNFGNCKFYKEFSEY